MTQRMVFNTVQDLIDFVVKNPLNGDRKWTLSSSTDWEYIDEQAGLQFEAELNNVPYPAYKYEKYIEIMKIREEILSRRPKQVSVKKYFLTEAGTGSIWSPSTTISLGKELGEIIASTWKTKTEVYGIRFVGAVTTTGILKRLGRTQIGSLVKSAKKAAEDEAAKRSRNYNRKRARELAQELLNIKKNNPGINMSSLIEEIVAMEDEE